MLDSLKFLDDLKLDNLDLASLKIPKNAIYLMIAFKLINNLDKIVPQLRNFARPTVPMPIPRPISNSSSMSLLVVFLLIGGAIILANNLLDRINISLMSCGVGALKDSNLKMPRNNCPIRKCPIFNRCSMKATDCPIKQKGIRSCPLFSNEIEKKLMELMDEKDKLQQELNEVKKKNEEVELLENNE
jgi:hypothetical protein